MGLVERAMLSFLTGGFSKEMEPEDWLVFYLAYYPLLLIFLGTLHFFF